MKKTAVSYDENEKREINKKIVVDTGRIIEYI